MPCIENQTGFFTTQAKWIAMAMLCLMLASCASRSRPPPVAPTPAPVLTPAPAQPPVALPPPAPPALAAPRLPLAANWADYRRRAAQMIIAANPGASFTGPQPAQWNGIATVTVLLNADGTIRALDLMRASRISPHVNELALAAARRVGNFGPASHLPGPWQFNETFLYNDANQFQLVTVVEGR
jgi:hypothetical protein